MAVLCLDPLQQFLDDEGNPLAGGFLHSYNAVTDTPQAIYTNTEGTVAHENPIELDSNGRPPSPLFYTQGAAYNLVLTDADLVELDSNISFEVPDLTETDASTYFDVEFFRPGTPGESERIYAVNLRHDVTFPTNWGVSGGVDPATPPAADCICIIKINGTQVGTATCSTLGGWTFATTGAATVEAMVDDQLEIFGPEVVSTIEDVGFTLVGALV